MEFLIERHAQYSSGEQLKPDALGELFSVAWTRKAIDEVVKKGASHLTQVKYLIILALSPWSLHFFQSYRLWDAQRDWELEILETASKSERHVFQLTPQTRQLIVREQADTSGVRTGLAP